MATIENSANFSGKNWGGYCQLTYTAGNGSINITGMAFKATNSTSAGYGAYYDNQQNITVTAGSQSKSCTLSKVRINSTSYQTATFSGASFSGLSGNTSVSFTCRARSSSPYNLTFNFTINAGSSVVVPTVSNLVVTPTSETTMSAYFTINSNGGATATGHITCNGQTVNSTSATFSGLTAGQSYTVTAYASNSAGNSTTLSNSKKTYTYPTITSTPDFTIGNELRIGLSNPLSRTCTVYIITDDGQQRLGPDNTSVDYISGYNNQESKNAWYQSIPNKPSGKYKVRLVCSAVGRDTTVNGGTYYPNATESKPIFNSFTWADINATTLALTDDSSTVIKDKSNIQATIPVANKATPQCYAGGIKRYEFRCGGKSNNEIPFSSSADVSGAINAVSSNVFEVRAVDTREIASDYVSLTAQNFIVYTPLSKTNASIHRVGEVSSQTTLEFEGQIDLENFGLVTNSIKSVTYGYKLASDANYTPGETTITPTVDAEGNFTFAGLIKGDEADGFNFENVYSVIVTVEDELSSVSWELTIPSGKPHLAWHKNGLSVMGKYDENRNDALQVNGNSNFKGDILKSGSNIFDLIYPIGAIYLSVNSTSPATLFGIGTWERIGVGRTLVSAGGGTNPVLDNTNTYTGRGTTTGVTSTNAFPVNEKGGELDHQLIISEMPQHRHRSSSYKSANGASGSVTATPVGLNNTGKTGDYYSEYIGGDGSHNTVQPYLAVYMWKRTA